MDYDTLRTLIDSDEANAGRTDTEVSDWCNEDSGTPRRVLKAEYLTTGRLHTAVGSLTRGLEILAALDAGTAEMQECARLIRNDPPDLGEALTHAMIDSLTGDPDADPPTGLIDADEAAALKALGQIAQTRAQAAGIPGLVLPGHVEEMRRLTNAE